MTSNPATRSTNHHKPTTHNVLMAFSDNALSHCKVSEIHSHHHHRPSNIITWQAHGHHTLITRSSHSITRTYTSVLPQALESCDVVARVSNNLELNELSADVVQ
mmetsp:Transcript_46536/g.76921  ORF Transcript_46536/g.76921 Transcript_46536/m.76921 type:complete len:104 (-) Transcript_46536:172-483(-)